MLQTKAWANEVKRAINSGNYSPVTAFSCTMDDANDIAAAESAGGSASRKAIVLDPHASLTRSAGKQSGTSNTENHVAGAVAASAAAAAGGVSKPGSTSQASSAGPESTNGRRRDADELDWDDEVDLDANAIIPVG